MVVAVEEGQCGAAFLQSVGTWFGFLSLLFGFSFYCYHARKKLSRVTQEPVESAQAFITKASPCNKLRVKAIFGFLWWIAKRAIAVLPQFISKGEEDEGSGSMLVFLVALDLLCSMWAAALGEYQPGSLYNHFFQMSSGRKLPKVYSDSAGFSWMWKLRIVVCLLGTFIAWQENVLAVTAWIGCGEGSGAWHAHSAETLAVLANTWTVFLIYPVIAYGSFWLFGLGAVSLFSCLSGSAGRCVERATPWLFSEAGTSSYALWTVFYERIETHVVSDGVDLIGLFDLDCLGLSAPKIPAAPAMHQSVRDEAESKGWEGHVEGKLAKQEKQSPSADKQDARPTHTFAADAAQPSVVVDCEVAVPPNDGVGRDDRIEWSCAQCNNSVGDLRTQCAACGAAQPGAQQGPMLLPGQVIID